MNRTLSSLTGLALAACLVAACGDDPPSSPDAALGVDARTLPPIDAALGVDAMLAPDAGDLALERGQVGNSIFVFTADGDDVQREYGFNKAGSAVHPPDGAGEYVPFTYAKTGAATAVFTVEHAIGEEVYQMTWSADSTGRYTLLLDGAPQPEGSFQVLYLLE